MPSLWSRRTSYRSTRTRSTSSSLLGHRPSGPPRPAGPRSSSCAALRRCAALRCAPALCARAGVPWRLAPRSSRRRDCHSGTHPSSLGRCFSRNGEGVDSKLAVPPTATAVGAAQSQLHEQHEGAASKGQQFQVTAVASARGRCARELAWQRPVHVRVAERRGARARRVRRAARAQHLGARRMSSACGDGLDSCRPATTPDQQSRAPAARPAMSLGVAAAMSSAGPVGARCYAGWRLARRLLRGPHRCTSFARAAPRRHISTASCGHVRAWEK